MEPSGSEAEEPGQGNRVQEPAATSPSSNGTPTAVPPPPPPPTGPLLERPRRQQPGGGADGSSSSAAAVDPKGKQVALPTPPSSSDSSAASPRSPDYGAAFRDGAFVVGESSGSKRVTWSDPVVAGTREVPALPPTPFDSRLVFEQVVIEQLVKEQSAFDEQLVKEQIVIEQMVKEQVALEKEHNRRREQMFNSLRAEEALYQKEKEKLPPVKEEPEQEKLPQVKRKSLWSQLKNKIFHRERREICSEHVAHQTHPITEVRRRYKIPSNKANHLDVFSECRAVIGDGDCFYRSFIFSYLEQVIDRQDTDEECRLLDVVERVSTQHANVRWNSEFPRSSKVFKKLIKKVMKWKRHGRSDSMESTSSYRKEKLLMFFSEYDTTEYIYIFLRLVVAIQMCSHKEVYEPRIPGLTRDYTLEDWCCRRVTPARRLTDHVMMLALATAFDVSLRVETFREGYAPAIYTGPGAPRPSVTLLYTGDHYEIIYPRAPSAESSSHQADQSSSQQTSQREHDSDQSSNQQTSHREHPADQSSSEPTS